MITDRSEKVQVFLYSQIRYEQVVLRTETQGSPDGLHVGLYVVSLNQRGTGRGTYESGQHRHRRRLAGTVVAQQHGYLIRMNVHGQLVDDVFARSETLAQRLDLYAGFFGNVFGTNFFLEPIRRLKQ